MAHEREKMCDNHVKLENLVRKVFKLIIVVLW
jgi:hypothetical protein